MKTKEWEEGFDMIAEKRGFAFLNNPPAIKHFIRNLLAAQKKDESWRNAYIRGCEETEAEVKKEMVEELEKAKLNFEPQDFISALDEIINKLKE